MSQTGIIQFSKVFEEVNNPTPQKYGEFELDQNTVLSFAHPWFAAIDNESTINLFKCGLYVKLITSIWSTLDESTAKQCRALGNIDSMYLPLPVALNSAISMVPWVETKLGVFKIKWPMTTLKTCFLNLQYFKKKAFDELGIVSEKTRDIPPVPAGQDECFNRRFWGDQEGYEKVDFFIARYLKGKGLPKLDKNYTDDQIDKLISETTPNFDRLRKVYRMYALSGDARLHLLNHPEKDEHKLLEVISLIGLNYCTVPIETLETDLIELMHVYEESELKDIFFM
ncbi:uncharacterized protein SPAPADRAFT_63722 [Spathaspora passalidarum NRRL Y-27907]|uniref:Uncharacterized protein n=1 Tax=Spathaspora passalidarum (strain NRRL Y-27907 / 11-Y1) TaxID=619300 RepID=G3AV32_SPAPN|nr:uncharacterized protein SPAPADRAFT_63722 [Spathaspora passalidarum NRRL Y-27907]EGW30106.1 hypothetical protein SPAPADRAFT_63722 [Spathaspora passalidarum NRRL Y-27907]